MIRTSVATANYQRFNCIRRNYYELTGPIKDYHITKPIVVAISILSKQENHFTIKNLDKEK
jgi:hypothetical protein